MWLTIQPENRIFVHSQAARCSSQWEEVVSGIWVSAPGPEEIHWQLPSYRTRRISHKGMSCIKIWGYRNCSNRMGKFSLKIHSKSNSCTLSSPQEFFFEMAIFSHNETYPCKFYSPLTLLPLFFPLNLKAGATSPMFKKNNSILQVHFIINFF